MRTKVIGTISFCLLCTAALLGGCASGSGSRQPSISGGKDIAIMPTASSESPSGIAQDKNMWGLTGIMLDIDTEQQTCTVQMLDTAKKVVYSYNGGTNVVNRYGKPILIEQLSIGEVVEIEYSDVNKKLTAVRASEKEWEYSGATNFTIDTEKKSVTVGSQKYNYTENLVVIQDGRIADIDKLAPVDVITLKGRDKQIDSILVTAGHGNVRLDSTAFFEGGFVEIGSKIVKVITENMVIPVPAGSYVLTVTKDDTTGSKEIQVGENEEIRINLTDFQSEAVRYGSVQFKITPSDAELEIDGKKTDYSALVDLPYGNHSVIIKKDGYNTYKETINIQSILTEYDISLIENGETSAQATEETTTSKEDKDDTKDETTTRKMNPETTTRKRSFGSLTDETTTYDYESAWYGIISDFLK